MEEVTGAPEGVEIELVVNGSDIEQELLPLEETEPAGDTDEKSRGKKLSSAVSSLRELDWESIAIIACLCVAYLLCNASYSIISPFFPNEASAWTSEVDKYVVKTEPASYCHKSFPWLQKLEL